MLVSCPKCSSRYQLSDDKVRSSGTKVRCPRCQNTFKVFPDTDEAKEVDSDRTELFVRRDEILNKAVAPKNDVTARATSAREEPAQKSQTTEAKTGIRPHQAAASAPETVRFTKPRDPSPFKRNLAETEALPNDDWENSEPHTDEEQTATATKTQKSPKVKQDPAKAKAPPPPSEEESEEATAKARPDPTEPKPFGDATFLAIQKMGGAKESKRRILMAVAFGGLVIAVFLFLTKGPQRLQQATVTQEVENAKIVELKRPSKWYEDDPAVFQRFLGQMATLPRAEQDRPENKALIAEALVLNGLFTGAYDQVAQGMAMASDLTTANPNESYGFYARAAYAVYKDDSSSLVNLVQKWPLSNQTDLEYKLATALVLSKSGQKMAGLTAAKELLETNASFERARMPILNAALDSSKDADLVFGEKLMSSLIKTFQKSKESLQASGTPLPDIYNNIEKKLLRRGAVAAAKPTPPKEVEEVRKPSPVAKAEPSKPAPVVKENEDSLTKSLNNRAKQQLEESKKQAPEPSPAPVATSKAEVPAPKAEPVKQPTKLPKPSEDLVASNKQAKQEESEAAKLYRQGLAQIEQSKLDEAVLSFQKSLRFDPDFADSYRKLGEIYMKKDDRERALRSFKIYLQLRPDSSDKQVVEGWISSLE